MSQIPRPWWHADIHADRRPFLLARNRIVTAVRGHFAKRGFVEVECGALQVSPGNEAHLHAMAAEAAGNGGETPRYWLHTSPEFACKKLLAAGETRIFSLAKCYRDRERSALHAPEFTMLEWYRARESYDSIMLDCVDLLRLAAHTAGTRTMIHRGIVCDAYAEPERLTVAEAFRRHAGVDLMATLDGRSSNRDALAREAARLELRVAGDDSWSDLYSRILVAHVEPHMGRDRPTLLYEYPAVEAALARVCASDPRVAERFELYACGVELANGFGELTDAEEQRRRFEEEMDVKERIYGERYPIDADFLAALRHMPDASGVALGLDRLVMLACGAERVDQVIWTPVVRPA